MNYLKKSFNVFMQGDKYYQENYDRIFGKKKLSLKEKIEKWIVEIFLMEDKNG